MPKSLFISYSHADDELLARMHKHLAQLKREGSVADWYDREITAGSRIDDSIDRQLTNSDIFLACASPDWIASQYAYEREFEAALEREAKGEAVVVPVIFKPCDWLSTPLKAFKALPKDGKPITEFTNQDVAFLDVVTELRRMIMESSAPLQFKSVAAPEPDTSKGRSSTPYRVKREFDQLHKRDFVEASFGEIYRFFESSVAELSSIPEIEARLSAIEGDKFSCTVINRGLRRGFATLHVRRGGTFGAIDIVYGDHPSLNTSNGGFSVEADEYQLLLRPSLFSMMGENKAMTARDAAKLLWDDLLSKVGIDYA